MFCIPCLSNGGQVYEKYFSLQGNQCYISFQRKNDTVLMEQIRQVVKKCYKIPVTLISKNIILYDLQMKTNQEIHKYWW